MAKTKKEAAPAETSNPLGGKAKTKKYLSQEKDVVPKKANMLDMIVEAVDANSERKGASLQYIKTYLTEKYPVDSEDIKSWKLKKALVKGVKEEILIRPKATENKTGMLGRFKVNKDRVKDGKVMKPKKTSKKVTKPDDSDGDDESTSKGKPVNKTTKKGKKGKNDEGSDEESKVSKSKKGDKKSKKTEPETNAKETKRGAKSKTAATETKRKM